MLKKAVLISSLFIFCFTIYLEADNLLRHVEPPFWYSGMKADQFQLMIHGDALCDYKVSISSSKVECEKVHRADNCNYLFIDLLLKDNSSAYSFEILLKNGKKKEKIIYEIKERSDRNNIKGFDQSDAIYLITPDRFSDGDPSNNDVDGYLEVSNRSKDYGRHGGDLAGIEKRLDYISDMGFTSIWLNPILENNMKDYSYHGYACTDYYQVDRRFGTNEEYRAFVKAAQDKGLKVIMDMIVNHSGSLHWWMDDLPYDDWINEWDSYTETNHKKTVLQDPNASAYDKEVYTDGWFVKTMPDLNQRHPHMSTYLIQNAVWWSEYLGLNGIRMDTYSYSDEAFMVEWVDVLNEEFPNLSIVGEEWNENPSVISYWQKGNTAPNSPGSNLQYLMDFPLNLSMAAALTEPEGWGSGLDKIYEALSMDFQYPNPNDLLVFPDNHDMPRILAQLDGDIDRLKMATAFYLTVRGIPQFYYGTEILMTSPKERHDGKIRSDFPGGWEGDEVNGFEDNELTEAQLDYKNYLSTLLEWRKDKDVVHYGKFTHFIPHDGFYTYFRYNEDETIMVVLNKNDETSALKLERYSEFLNDYRIGVNVIDQSATYELDEAIDIKSNSAIILELSK